MPGIRVMNFEFESWMSAGEVAIDFDMACRDGPTLKLVPFQAILFYGRRQFAPIMASNYSHNFVRFLLCALDYAIRLGHGFVQSGI